MPTTLRSRRPARRTYHHRNARAALISAALNLTALRGPNGWSLREAAMNIGITHPAAYRHFASKAALVAAAAEEATWALAAALEHAAQRAARDARESVANLAEAYVAFAMANAAATQLMFSRDVSRKAGHPGLRAASDAAATPILRVLARCRADGLLGNQGGTDVDLAVPLWALVHGFAVLAVAGQLREGPLHLTTPDDPRTYVRAARRAVVTFLRGV
jgi:AcrR family transcriptional regulator